MKNYSGKSKGSTLSKKVMLLRYRNARNNHVNKFSISDLHFTNDTKAWLKDKKNRNWLNYNKEYVYLK